MPDWLSEWSLSPLQTVPLLLGCFFYLARARRLGPRLPAFRLVAFLAGAAVIALAIVSPIDPIGEEDLFWVHMLQHVLLGDIGAVLLVIGLTGPILQPALAIGWVQRLRVLTHPFVALPLWAVNLYVWHVPYLYELSLTNSFVHALEHVTFVAFGMAMWSPILEALPAPAWFGTGPKLAYAFAVRAAAAILGNIFWFSGTVFYDFYDQPDKRFDIDPLADQINAGTVMMIESGILTAIVLTILFFRLARESEMRQTLLEAGLDRDAVNRAVRYGRVPELARRHGVTLG